MFLKIAIHQPNYLPYPGFFAKLALSDIFVIYDTAQFSRGEYMNRNVVRNFSNNGCIWLTLPVGKKNFKNVCIKDIQITDTSIFEKHQRTLTSLYSKAPFFDEKLCSKIGEKHKNLAEHNFSLISFFINNLYIKKPKIVFSSEFAVNGKSTQAIISLIKSLGGTEYISGVGGRGYLEENLFEKNNIKLSYINYKPLTYTQIHPGFVENVSIVDAIFNIGWKKTSQMICEC
jgi:hypothetical protein